MMPINLAKNCIRLPKFNTTVSFYCLIMKSTRGFIGLDRGSMMNMHTDEETEYTTFTPKTLEQIRMDEEAYGEKRLARFATEQQARSFIGMIHKTEAEITIHPVYHVSVKEKQKQNVLAPRGTSNTYARRYAHLQRMQRQEREAALRRTGVINYSHPALSK
jgi:hypothetical protein